jgi:hypothetical protein
MTDTDVDGAAMGRDQFIPVRKADDASPATAGEL